MDFSGISLATSEMPSYPNGHTAQIGLISQYRHRKERGSKFIYENILKKIAARCLRGSFFPVRAVPGCFQRVAGVAIKCEPLAWPGLSGNRFLGNVIF